MGKFGVYVKGRRPKIYWRDKGLVSIKNTHRGVENHEWVWIAFESDCKVSGTCTSSTNMARTTVHFASDCWTLVWDEVRYIVGRKEFRCDLRSARDAWRIIPYTNISTPTPTRASLRSGLKIDYHLCTRSATETNLGRISKTVRFALVAFGRFSSDKAALTDLTSEFWTWSQLSILQ